MFELRSNITKIEIKIGMNNNDNSLIRNIQPLYTYVLALAPVKLCNSNDEIKSSSFVASIRFCLNLYIINGKSGSLELNLFHGQKTLRAYFK